ncbi:MAG: sialate O-acetylesterase, partial [Verrucomicrobiales bacterium]
MKPMLIQNSRSSAFLLAILATTTTLSLSTDDAHADVAVPAIFADNMVLQRGQTVPIWGTAEAEEKVTVSFAGQTKSATTDANGNWKVALDALEASAEPASLKISGKNAIALNNVLVGEVWIGSGQS